MTTVVVVAVVTMYCRQQHDMHACMPCSTYLKNQHATTESEPEVPYYVIPTCEVLDDVSYGPDRYRQRDTEGKGLVEFCLVLLKLLCHFSRQVQYPDAFISRELHKYNLKV